MYVYSLRQYELETLICHPPLQLINLTSLCNTMDLHLLIHLDHFFHAYNCEQLIPTETGEKEMEKALPKHRCFPTYQQNHFCEFEDDIFAVFIIEYYFLQP